MILMLPLGIIYFTIMVTLIALAGAFIAAPIAAIVFNVPFEAISYGEVIWHLPDYLTPLIAVLGVLLATVTMHIARWIGKVHGLFAKALLVSD